MDNNFEINDDDLLEMYEFEGVGQVYDVGGSDDDDDEEIEEEEEEVVYSTSSSVMEISASESESESETDIPEILPILPPEPDPDPPAPVIPEPESMENQDPKRCTSAGDTAPDPKSDNKSNEDDEESNTCIICCEPYTNSGEHRICCLKCGHTYGKNCIEKWIKNEARCPQCNSHASKKDIRIIYVKNLKVLDTAERDQILAQLHQEQELKRKLELECARLRMLTKSKDDQMSCLYTELAELKERAGNIYRGDPQASSSQQPGTSAAVPGTSLITKGAQLVLVKNIQFKDADCRVGAFDDWLNMLTISQSVQSSLYPSGAYGIKRINLLDLKVTSVTPIHQKEIRDLEFSNNKGGILLSVGLDKRCVLSNCSTNVTVQTFTAEAPLWSCCWNLQSQHTFYAGTANGSIVVYDTRNPSQTLNTLTIPEDGRSPIASLKYVTPSYSNSAFTLSGLLVQRLNSCWFCEIRNEEVKFHQLPLEGSFMSLDFDQQSRHVLVSTRPSLKEPNSTSRQIVCQLTQYFSEPQQSNICSCNIVQNFSSDQASSGRIFRSSIFSPDNQRTLVGSNGSPRTARIWDVSDANYSQSLPVPDQILDFVPCKMTNRPFMLGMISKEAVSLYKHVS